MTLFGRSLPKMNFFSLVTRISCRRNLPQQGRTIFKRNFAEKRYSDLKKILEDKKRFDKDFNTPEDTVIFSYLGKEWRHTMIVIAGITGMLMLLNSAHVVYLSWDTINIVTDDGDRKSWWKRVNRSSTTKYTLMAIMIVSGILIAYLSNYYVCRVIKSITLMKGGNTILLELYRPFGRTKIREFSIEDVTSGWSPRKEVTDYTVRVRGERVGFIMDTKDGIIHDWDQFYSSIGVLRDLSKKPK